jgi:hypothetical protein
MTLKTRPKSKPRKVRSKTIVADAPMTAGQTVALRQLAYDAFEADAFKPNITQAEAQRRIATLSAKLVLLDEPPHTL